MRLRLPRIGLPLLARELVEQAARRRTYVVRAVYAAILFFAFAVYFYEEVSQFRGQAFQILGVGAQVFEFLVFAQFIGIFLFLPAMAAGAITYEKERRSLELLFLTGLKPWEILLQKYASRLVPMFSFLLMSLPLMAIAYALGGISRDQVFTAVWLLVLACLQVAALSLMVSSFCRTTAQAIIGTYVVGALFYLLVPIVYVLFALLVIPLRRMADPEDLFFFLPIYVCEKASRRDFEYAVAVSIPICFSVVVFLLLARAFLVRRAFAPAKQFTLRLFRWLDGLMKRANRVVGNVMIVKDRRTLPANDPIAWRETAKKSLGKVHYLFRILVVVEVPVAFISVIALMSPETRGRDGELFSVLVFIIWAISVLAISVVSANAVASERTNQTLEVLLTTPIAGRDIVLQKMRAVRRLMYVFLVPFFTLFITEAWWENASSSYPYGYGDGEYRLGTFDYLVSSALSVFIFLPMYSWFGMWMGLRSKSRTRAILGTLGGVVAWSVLPVAAAVMFAILWEPDGDMWVYLTLFGPTTMKVLTEFGNDSGDFQPFHAPPLVPMFLAYVWHAGLFIGLRHWCLKDADRFLGRVPSEHAKRWQWLRSGRARREEASGERPGAGGGRSLTGGG